MAEFGSREWLDGIRACGVKRAEYHQDGKLTMVEFFEPPALARFDTDTLVPPAPDGEPEQPRVAKPAPALARLLKNGSVS
jgi:hypothetical protein